MAEFVSGDTGSTLLVTCQDDAGAAIDLTGATVRLHWQDATGNVQDKAMTIVDATTGKCSYKFDVDELFAPGMSFEVEITDIGGKKLSNVDLISVTVREQLG